MNDFEISVPEGFGINQFDDYLSRMRETHPQLTHDWDATEALIDEMIDHGTDHQNAADIGFELVCLSLRRQRQHL